MSLSVLRLKNSAYFPTDFNQRESTQLPLPYYFKTPPQAPCPLILITNTETYSQEILKIHESNEIRLIIHPNSGYENFDVELVKEMKIPFILGNSIRAQAVAQYLIANFLSHFLRPHQKSWNRDFEQNKSSLVSKKEVLLFGHGHVGKLVEQQLKPLVQKLDIIDPYKKDCLTLKDVKIENYDAILLACSLNEENKEFINADFLQKLKDGCLIINPARGALISWEAIVNSPHLQFVLDVFPYEPFPIDKYCQNSNLKMTSHIAGCHSSLSEAILNFESHVIQDYLKLNFHEFLNKYEHQNLKNKIKGKHFL